MIKKLQKTSLKLKISHIFKNVRKILQKNIIYLHPLTLAIFAIFIIIGRLKIVLIYAPVVLLHELSHLLVAKKLGYVCHKIRLMPYGAVLDAETDDFSFKDEIIIALAGPLFNLAISLVIVCLWWIYPSLYNFTDEFLLCNLIMGLFNLLPIFPLDGGRILLAVFSLKNGRQASVRFMKMLTFIFGVILFVLFICSLFVRFNLTLGTMGLMLVCSSFFKDKKTRFERVSYFAAKTKKSKNGLVVKTILVNKSTTLARIFKMLDLKTYTVFYVCEDNLKIKNVVFEKDLEQLLLKFSINTKIGDCINF